MKKVIAILAVINLAACCPVTQQTKDMTMAAKCHASPSCQAALDKLSNDVK